MSSIRSSQGIPYQDLSGMEIDKEIELLKAQITQINTQAIDIKNRLQQNDALSV